MTTSITDKKKTTVLLSESLLIRARSVTGTNVTATIAMGLELLAAQAAYQTLKSAKGSYTPKIDLEQLRDDDKKEAN